MIVLAFLAGLAVMAAAWKAVARADEGSESRDHTVTHAALEVIAKGMLETVTLLRQQGGQMTDLKTDAEALLAAAAENKTALENLTAKVDAALAQAAGRPEAVSAAIQNAIATLKGTTAEAATESAKVDAALAPAETTVDTTPAIEPVPEASAPAEAPAAEPTPEAPVAPTEG